MSFRQIKTLRSLKKSREIESKTSSNRKKDIGVKGKKSKKKKRKSSKISGNSEVKVSQENVADGEKKGNTVKRSKVRVKSAKGVRKINVENVRTKPQQRKNQNTNQKPGNKSNLKVKYCHHSFTNLYYDF